MTSDQPSDPAEDPSREPGWRRGPDPNAPPWATDRDEDAEGRDAEREDAEGRDAEREDAEVPGGGSRDGRAPRSGHERRSRDDPRRDGGPGSTAAADEGAPAGPPSHELAEIPHGVLPPRPPRRTGVFVDPDDLREHVGGLLRTVLGGYEVDAFGNFTFTHEGARVFVTVGGSPIGPQVGIFSVTNLDLELTPPLAAFLLTTNHTLGFGSFSYDPGNQAVWLRHTLLGTTLDLPELQSAVAAVATTAARLDHAIQERFGGRTFQEAPSEVQRKMEPPEPIHDERPPNASGYL